MPRDHHFADLVFTGGPVYTVDPARSWAGSVAVRDGRIVVVGHDHDVRHLIGANTEVVDLAGKLLLPGFQDSHVHPVLAGAGLRSCALYDLEEADAYVDAVAAYAAAYPQREWITGGGWSMEAFPGGTPHRSMLDAVVPERPVALPNRDGHGLWANSRALEIAGIDRDTPDPADGRIERDSDGVPTGMLQEGAADLVTRHIPAITDEEFYEGLLEGQRHLHGFGITGWQDAAVGSGFGPGDVYGAYLVAAGRGTLTARVRGAQWWDRDGGLEQLAGFADRREQAAGAGEGRGRFRAGSVKIMLDGVAENHTAAMLEPYLDGCGCSSGESGIDFIDPGKLAEYVSELDAAGFQVHFHALGDRAVRSALDAVEEAQRRNGRRGNRHHLAHLQVVHPDDIPRFRALGATANIQPLWAMHEPQMDELTIPFLGDRRSGWQYPFGSLLRAGAMLAAGSDWSVSTPDVMLGAHVAVNRCGPEDGERVFGPEERIDLGAAIAAYTAGSARVNHLDAETGSVQTGKYADLVVLDRDPFAGPARDIGRTGVDRTYVEGVLVHATS
ncbi:amidohydrolase [Streptomyces sp. NBC_01306]|uniref:amidohydrolase n=1 Tax=Streptomyces sp. NBC_01306 TaxID=2903819 RepID=UPI002252CB9A|nr:amidohydrolase [Streptomyces sp. NBC_01306]MCX4722343.1 amidohydrolase family protein [Streptomyces sp. NBC_01306]